jgi:predicted phage terminase large subunit-like protein
MQAHHPDYAAVLFRKTYKQITEAGGLADRSRDIYADMGAHYFSGQYRWKFPNAAQVAMRHLQNPSDRFNYRGAEYGFIGFDQLEDFDLDTYLYLFSRARSTNPSITPQVCATANPGARWVLSRWLPWLGLDEELEEAGLPRAEPGEVLYFKRDHNDNDVVCEPDDPDGLSRTFIPASVYDNPALLENDPGYLARLMALPYVERQQLLFGDWHVEASAGKVFQRDWWAGQIVGSIPALTLRVRAFDLAGTEKKTLKDDPDYTANVLMGLRRRKQASKPLDEYYIEEADQDRIDVSRIDNYVLSYHESDPLDIPYIFEQEPGQSGKKQIYDLKRLCRGRVVRGVTSRQDKVARAGPLSSDTEAGLVFLLQGPWNSWYIRHMQNFPSPSWHDDIVDASTLGHHAIVTGLAGGWARGMAN